MRFLSFVAVTTGCNAKANLCLYNCDERLSCKIECWAPLHATVSKIEGAVCCKDLVTFFGIIPETRVRESDVVAIEIDLSEFETCK